MSAALQPSGTQSEPPAPTPPQGPGVQNLVTRHKGQMALATDIQRKEGRPHNQGQSTQRQASNPTAVMESGIHRAKYPSDELPGYMDEFLPGSLPT